MAGMIEICVSRRRSEPSSIFINNTVQYFSSDEMAATNSFHHLPHPLFASSSNSNPTPKPKQLLPASRSLLLLASSSSLSSSSFSSYPLISLTSRHSPAPLLSRTTTTHFMFTGSNSIHLLRHKNNNTTTTPRPFAAAASSSDAAIPEQMTVPDAATSTIISALLLIAFVGLSILTIGVIYIAVTDFLQKREGEKFQKEETEKRKKGGGKKRRLKARAGPKGFGQKIVEIDEADDDI